VLCAVQSETVGRCVCVVCSAQGDSGMCVVCCVE